MMPPPLITTLPGPKLAEFCTAARDALDGKYSPLGLRERAIASNGRSAIADKFDVYFRQLHSLYTTGFYS